MSKYFFYKTAHNFNYSNNFNNDTIIVIELTFLWQMNYKGTS